MMRSMNTTNHTLFLLEVTTKFFYGVWKNELIVKRIIVRILDRGWGFQM